MILRRSHPLLNGCRLLLWPAGRYWSNRVGQDATPTVTGTPVVSAVGPYPAISLDGTAYEEFAALDSYGNLGRDFSIVVRVRATDVPASSSGFGIAGARSGFPTDAGFVFFLGNTPGAGEASWVFAVHGATGQTLKVADSTAASAYLNQETHVAATYNSRSRELNIFVNGLLAGTQANVGVNWQPWGAADDLFLGSLNAGGVPFVGDIGPVLIYDRCLDDGEVLALQKEGVWPFLKDSELLSLYPAFSSYSTGISVAEATGIAGAVSYVTTLDSTSGFTGDLESAGPTGTAAYTTVVNVRSVGLGEEPEFARYTTGVSITQAYSPSQPINYSTHVLVSQHKAVRLDGRTNLLDSFRYRR